MCIRNHFSSSINDHCNTGVEKQSQGQQTVIGMVPGDTHFFAAEQIYIKLQHWIHTFLITLMNNVGFMPNYIFSISAKLRNASL